jgi:hypothetical protein
MMAAVSRTSARVHSGQWQMGSGWPLSTKSSIQMVARASSSGMSVLNGDYGGGSGKSGYCGLMMASRDRGMRVQIDCIRGYSLDLARDGRLERHIVSFARITLFSMEDIGLSSEVQTEPESGRRSIAATLPGAT